jgi:hypothetical protein
MKLSVHDRAAALATFRFVEVKLMEIVAFWTPTTPEMEVKVMFGRHIWEFAQHADALGKRTFELRQPEHYTLAATEAYTSLLTDVKGEATTAGRLAGLYDVVLPGLITRYSDYLASTDALLDQPSLVIIERILADARRQIAEARSVRESMSIATQGMNHLRERETAVSHLVA